VSTSHGSDAGGGGGGGRKRLTLSHLRDGRPVEYLYRVLEPPTPKLQAPGPQHWGPRWGRLGGVWRLGHRRATQKTLRADSLACLLRFGWSKAQGGTRDSARRTSGRPVSSKGRTTCSGRPLAGLGDGSNRSASLQPTWALSDARSTRSGARTRGRSANGLATRGGRRRATAGARVDAEALRGGEGGEVGRGDVGGAPRRDHAARRLLPHLSRTASESRCVSRAELSGRERRGVERGHTTTFTIRCGLHNYANRQFDEPRDAHRDNHDCRGACVRHRVRLELSSCHAVEY
jgi:hypothetical protein